jgi:hypothetical protein
MEIENQFHQIFKLIGIPEFGSALQMPLSIGATGEIVFFRKTLK